MQTNQTTADQFINTINATNTAADTNVAGTSGKSYTDNPATGKTKPPLPITIICVLGAIGFGLTAGGVILGWKIFAAIGTVFFIYSIAATVASLFSIIWLFQMKKRGAYLYAALFIIGQAMMAAYGVWGFNLTFIIGLAITGITLFYSKQMK